DGRHALTDLVTKPVTVAWTVPHHGAVGWRSRPAEHGPVRQGKAIDGDVNRLATMRSDRLAARGGPRRRRRHGGGGAAAAGVTAPGAAGRASCRSTEPSRSSSVP